MTLKEHMTKHNLKRLEMADRIGCDAQYVFYLLSGERDPSLKMMRTIMKATFGDVMPNDWL